MRCAQCDEMHHGLKGLSYYETEPPSDRPRLVRTYGDMLCTECGAKRRTGDLTPSEAANALVREGQARGDYDLPEPTQSYYETEEEWS